MAYNIVDCCKKPKERERDTIFFKKILKNALKKEVEVLSAKLAELTEEELAQVSCGQAEVFPIPGSEKDFNNQAAANDRPIKILN